MTYNNPEALTPAQAAEFCGVPIAMINYWVTKADLQYELTPGGHRRFKAADLRQLTSGPDNPDLLDVAEIRERSEDLHESVRRLWLHVGEMESNFISRMTSETTSQDDPAHDMRNYLDQSFADALRKVQESAGSLGAELGEYRKPATGE